MIVMMMMMMTMMITMMVMMTWICSVVNSCEMFQSIYIFCFQYLISSFRFVSFPQTETQYADRPDPPRIDISETLDQWAKITAQVWVWTTYTFFVVV